MRMCARSDISLKDTHAGLQSCCALCEQGRLSGTEGDTRMYGVGIAHSLVFPLYSIAYYIYILWIGGIDNDITWACTRLSIVIPTL